MFKYGVNSGPYFPALGLNTQRYEVFSPNTSTVFRHFSCSDIQWNPTPGGCPKNSSSVPVLKIIRKWNACEEENLYFKGFLVTGSQYIAGFFRIATFSYNFYRLLENIQCFYHLPKLKAIRLKVSVMKNVYKICKRTRN